MTNSEILLRLGVALILGMIIGFERKLVHKEAGMRTYGIVALSCALFMLSAVNIGNNFGLDLQLSQEKWRALTNVLGALITGIGFLGVGLIFYSKEDHARVGLTSAATLLCTAAIGAACGLGFYKVAIVAEILIMLTLTVGFYFENWLLKVLKK